MPVRFVPSTKAPTHLGAFRGATAPATPEPIGVPLLPTFVPGYNFAALLGFGVDTTTDPSTWPLIDVSLDVQQTPGISTVRGRFDENSTTMPAQCTLVLDNRSGNYSPRRPQSIYYPYVRVGMPLQIVVATMAGRYERFSGSVSAWEPDWDTTGNYAVINVTAHGALNRLGQGNDPVVSSLRRAILTGSPIAYWPMEDGSQATSFASAVAGGTALSPSHTITFASNSDVVGSAALPDFATVAASMSSTIPAGSTTSWRVEFVFEVPTTSTLSDNPALVSFTTSGTSEKYVLYAGPAGFGLSLSRWTAGVSTGYNASGAAPALSDGLPRHVRMDGITSGGTYGFKVYLNNVLVMSDSGLSGTLGMITGHIDNGGSISTPAGPVTEFTTFGHLAFYSPAPASTDATYQAFIGHVGETAAARLARLCSENSVPFRLYGAAGTRTMGAQSAGTLLSLLRECEAVGGGVLEDGVNFGLAYHELESRYNQTATMTPALTQLAPPFRPVESDQYIRNNVTATRSSGSSGFYIQPAGAPYAPTGAGGIGTITDSKTLNVDTDTVLAQRAAWFVHLGTVDADRYPTLNFNFAVRTALIPSWLTCANGSRITVASTYPTGGQAPDVLLEGWTETLSTFVWDVQANCSPSLPWTVAVFDSALYDSATSSLATLAPTGSTSLSVATTSTTLWKQGAVSFDINVGGVRYTVSNITGAASPQTFTVGAPVNGIVKDLPANTQVKLWTTPMYAL